MKKTGLEIFFIEFVQHQIWTKKKNKKKQSKTKTNKGKQEHRKKKLSVVRNQTEHLNKLDNAILVVHNIGYRF